MMKKRKRKNQAPLFASCMSKAKTNKEANQTNKKKTVANNNLTNFNLRVRVSLLEPLN